MFKKKIKYTFSYLREQGILQIYYKLYKRLISYYYTRRFKLLGNHMDTDTNMIPMIVTSNEPTMVKDINSKVSILLLFEGRSESFERCLDSILKVNTQTNYEIIIIASSPFSDCLLTKLHSQISIQVILNDLSDRSHALNAAAKIASGHYLLLVHHPIAIRNPKWMEELLQNIGEAETGAAGFVLSNHVALQVNVHTVIPICLLIEAELYAACNGLNRLLQPPYADIDLCLRVRDKGKRVRFSSKPMVQSMEAQNKMASYEMDKALLRNRWQNQLNPDLYFEWVR